MIAIENDMKYDAHNKLLSMWLSAYFMRLENFFKRP